MHQVTLETLAETAAYTGCAFCGSTITIGQRAPGRAPAAGRRPMNRVVARRRWASRAVGAAALIVIASAVYLLVSDGEHRRPFAPTRATPVRVHWSSLAYPNRIRAIVLAAGTQPVLETT